MDQTRHNEEKDKQTNNPNGAESGGEETRQEDLIPMTEETRREGSDGEEERPPGRRSRETSISRNICGCTNGRNTVASEAIGGKHTRCNLCGKILVTELGNSRTTGLHFDEPRPPSNGGTGPLNLVLGQAFANGLHFLPDTTDTSLEGNGSSIAEGDRNSLSVAEQGVKTPVHGDSPSSVQIPSPKTQFTFFVLEQDQPESHGKVFHVHFVTTARFQEGQVLTWIKKMEESLNVKLHVVSIGDEYFTLQENKHFHVASVEDHIVVTFQLVKQEHSKFRLLRDHQITNKVPLSRLLALSQNRIFPGATAKVFVESLAQPGEICEDHLRMTMDCGNSIRHMLIPIWPVVEHDFQEKATLDGPRSVESFWRLQCQG